MTDIQVGDVCLDLAQGRPVHVVEDTGQDAREWSDANGYELTTNYGNSRLGATGDDAVLEVVYCSSVKSEPSKTYAMPESRLLRVETESADGGRPVYDRIASDVLAAVFATDADLDDPNDAVVASALNLPTAVVSEARELADIEQRFGDDDA